VRHGERRLVRADEEGQRCRGIAARVAQAPALEVDPRADERLAAGERLRFVEQRS
jgi:hypothetical protein